MTPEEIEYDTRSVRRRRRWAIVLILVGVAGLITLYCVPPRPGSIYPPCLFYMTLGLHCPGCGATRCMHALVHGRIADAASFNLLFFLSLPVIAFFVGRALYRALAGKLPRLKPVPTWWIIALAVLLISFGVLRNIPYPPFERLAPGRLFDAPNESNSPGERTAAGSPVDGPATQLVMSRHVPTRPR